MPGIVPEDDLPQSIIRLVPKEDLPAKIQAPAEMKALPPAAENMGQYLINRAGEVVTGKNITDIMSAIGVGEPMVSGVESARKRIGIVPGMVPPSVGGEGKLQRTAANIVTAPFDVLSYLGTGGIPLKISQSMAAAAGGDIMGDIGRELGPTGKEGISGFVGGMLGGAGAGMIPGSIKSTVETGASLVKQAKDVYKEGGGEQARAVVDAMANTYVRNIFQGAAKADPNFVQKLQEGVLLSKSLGKDLPVGAMVDNPVIRKEIDKLLATNPDFKAKYQKQWDDATEAVRLKQEKLFGVPAAATPVKVFPTIVGADRKVAGRIEALNQNIAKVSEQVSPTTNYQELGARAENLIEAKKAAARASVQPDYDKAFKIAEDNNLTLPKEAVEDIYTFVSDKTINDIFKTMQPVYKKISAIFKPSQADEMKYDPSTRLIGPVTEISFSDKKVADLDSLKREVNSEIRKTKDETKLRLLEELKSKVNDSIYATGKDTPFAEAYKAADTKYYELVGIPYSSETIKSIGRARWDEAVLPAITKNKSTLSEFLHATRGEGRDIAESAFLLDFDKYTVTNGIVDVKKAERWLKANDTALTLLPGVRGQISDTKNVISSIEQAKGRLEAQFVASKRAEIVSDSGMTSKQIIDAMYRDPQFVSSFIKKHGQNRDTVQALRSIAIDDVLSAANPVELLNDRAKQHTFNRLFGGSLSKVIYLAQSSERLKSHDPSKIATAIEYAIPKDQLEQMTGIPATQAFSQLRNQIISVTQKIANLGSKVYTSAVAKQQEQLLHDLLLDPKQVDNIVKIIEATDKGVPVGKKEAVSFANKIIGISKRYAQRKGIEAVKGAYIGGGVGAVEEQVQQTMPGGELQYSAGVIPSTKQNVEIQTSEAAKTAFLEGNISEKEYKAILRDMGK